MGEAGQTPWQSAGDRGVLLQRGACLKIPSTGREAPPVRRRRFLGGVRVIHAPHVGVDSGLASFGSAARVMETWDSFPKPSQLVSELDP